MNVNNNLQRMIDTEQAVSRYNNYRENVSP
jgi:hypothetical protein